MSSAIVSRPIPHASRLARPEICVAEMAPRDAEVRLAPLIELVLMDAFLDTPHFALEAKRALACTCFAARAILYEQLHASILHVQPTDATWSNAVFVASLPTLETLCVAGETHLPQMRLRYYRTLPRLKVGALDCPAALFFGAAIARCDTTLRLSDGMTTRSLKPLREQTEVLLPTTASAADCLALLGALSLNPNAPYNASRGAESADPIVRAAWKAVMMPSAPRTMEQEDRAQALARLHEHAGDTRGLNFIRKNWMWMDDREFALAAIQVASPHALKWAPQAIRADRDVLRAAVERDGLALQYASPDLLADPEMVRAAVAKSGFALQFASEAPRADREIVQTAVLRDGAAFRYADEDLRADRSLLLDALSTHWSGADSPLEYATADYRHDREVLHAAGRLKPCSSAFSYRYASPQLMASRDFVLEAVSICGSALAHAALPLRADREVARTALAQDGRAFMYLADALQTDRDFVLELMHTAADASDETAPHGGLSRPTFYHVSAILRGDREIALAAVARNSCAMTRVGTALLNDRQFVLDAVAADGAAYRSFLAPSLLSDREVVLTALRTCVRAFSMAPRELRDDRSFVLAAVRVNGHVLSVREPRDLSASAAGGFQEDREVVLAAVEQDGMALEHATSEMQDDPEVVATAIRSSMRRRQDRSPLAFVYASCARRKDPSLLALAGGVENLTRCKLIGSDGFCLNVASALKAGVLRMPRADVE